MTKNRGFIDSNKRVALHATESLLRLHMVFLECTQNDRVLIMKELATENYSAEQFKLWLVANSQIVPSVIITGTITIRTCSL